MTYRYGERGMKERIEIIDKNNVRVIRQATILGFIDVGSEVEVYYRRKNAHSIQWRDLATGERADIWLEVDIDDVIETWEWLSQNKLDQPTE